MAALFFSVSGGEMIFPARASGVDHPPVLTQPPPAKQVRKKSHADVDRRSCLRLAEQLEALEKKKQERKAQNLEAGPELNMDDLRPAMELCEDAAAQ